jgi:small redox-active disulfide protein 2
MKIKVLGTGCPSCKRLEKNVKEALDELSIKAEVEKVTEVKDIMAYGVMSTPALVVDEKVVLYGHVPNVSQLLNIIKKEV